MRSGGQSVRKYFSRYGRSRACLHPQIKFQFVPLRASHGKGKRLLAYQQTPLYIPYALQL